MGKSDLPDEVCTACGVVITWRMKANIFDDQVVCSKCYSSKRDRRERESSPASDAQKRYARDLGIRFQPGVTMGEISTLLDAHIAIHGQSPAPKGYDLFSDDGRIQGFFTRLRGVTEFNDDGMRRQDIIARCAAGQQLWIRSRQTDSSDCLPAYARGGVQIGVLSERVADLLAKGWQAGMQEFILIVEITGGRPERPMRGVNVLVMTARDATESEVSKWAKKWFSERT